MNSKWKYAIVIAVLLALAGLVAGLAALQPAAEDPVARSYGCAVYTEQGCAKMVVATGGELEVQSGATLDIQSGATTDLSGGVDLDGALLDLDADGDTSIQADTDDTVDFEVSGSDDFQITANTFTILDGSKIDTESGTTEGVVFSANVATSYDVITTTGIAIPANADVVDWAMIVSTAYDDSGTDVMACGSVADPDAYVDDLDLEATGRNQALDGTDMQLDEATFGDVGNGIVVTCVYAGQNSNASAGVGRFIIWWRLD